MLELNQKTTDGGGPKNGTLSERIVASLLKNAEENMAITNDIFFKLKLINPESQKPKEEERALPKDREEKKSLFGMLDFINYQQQALRNRLVAMKNHIDEII